MQIHGLIYSIVVYSVFLFASSPLGGTHHLLNETWPVHVLSIPYLQVITVHVCHVQSFSHCDHNNHHLLQTVQVTNIRNLCHNIIDHDIH